MAPSHYLNQCWNIVNWTLKNKLQWNFNQISKLFIQENASENTVGEMAAILSRWRWVNHWHAVCNIIVTLDHAIKTNLMTLWHRVSPSGALFNVKMYSYLYRKSHCEDKTVVRSSYIHNGISFTHKMTSLYWIRAQKLSYWPGSYMKFSMPTYDGLRSTRLFFFSFFYSLFNNKCGITFSIQQISIRGIL